MSQKRRARDRERERGWVGGGERERHTQTDRQTDRQRDRDLARTEQARIHSKINRRIKSEQAKTITPDYISTALTFYLSLVDERCVHRMEPFVVRVYLVITAKNTF